jgi:hypothetical protein
VQAPEGHEIPAWMGCITLCHVRPILAIAKNSMYLARVRQHQLTQRSQPSRIIKYADPHGQHPSQRADSHDHSRSSSSGSLDIDEMLLRATTGDEHGEDMPNRPGAPYVDSSHHSHLNINQRRRNERDGDSPRPHSANVI